MAANSTIILNSQSHTDSTASPMDLVSEKFKGAGFYGMGDGFHTVQIQLTSFKGTISIQGSLATSPADEDWVNVSLDSSEGSVTEITYGAITSSNKVYNFIGNFVWVRAVVSNWTTGAINRVLLNY